MFASPFVAQLGNGHVDGVYAIAKDPGSLSRFASGSGDGVVKVWDISSREEIWQARAHRGIVRGLAWTAERNLLTCGSDRNIKLFNPYTASGVATWVGENAFTSLSTHRSLTAFAAASTAIHIYDLERPGSLPTHTLAWPTSVDTISSVAFNPSETSLLASTASDRSLVLYDLRTDTPLHRSILTLSSNQVRWNPMESFNLAVANEDHNVYIFDSRNLSRALNVLKDHVSAVMDLDWSPTGEELVSASYDKTVRLWKRSEGHSRDVYHTSRMQRAFSCTWTMDNNYVVTGSDDGNVRLWRAQAAARTAVKSASQRMQMEYDEALRQRYKHMPEIKRISRHRHIPKQIKKAGEIKREELAALKRREENERKHSRKGLNKRRSEREKPVLTTQQ